MSSRPNVVFIMPDQLRHDWPQMLGEQGYYTAAVGKMHFYPWDAMFGLDHRVICEDKVWVNIQDDYDDYLQERGHRKYTGHKGTTGRRPTNRGSQWPTDPCGCQSLQGRSPMRSSRKSAPTTRRKCCKSTTR